MYQRSYVRTAKKITGLMILMQRFIYGAWARDRSRVNWEESVRCQVSANETDSETKSQFSVRNRDVLMNAQTPHKWWSTLKSRVFTLIRHYLPLLVRILD